MRNTKSPLASLAAIGVCLMLSAPRAQGPSGTTIDDLINLKRVGAPAISPDGS
jgi:hypothetical protein